MSERTSRIIKPLASSTPLLHGLASRISTCLEARPPVLFIMLLPQNVKFRKHLDCTSLTLPTADYSFPTVPCMRITRNTYLTCPSLRNSHIADLGLEAECVLLFSIVEIPMQTLCGSQFEKHQSGMINPNGWSI